MICCFILYELESMSCMIGCLYMMLVFRELSDWLVKHELSVVGRNSIALVRRALGGASSVGRNPMDLPNRSPWLCLT